MHGSLNAKGSKHKLVDSVTTCKIRSTICCPNVQQFQIFYRKINFLTILLTDQDKKDNILGTGKHKTK